MRKATASLFLMVALGLLASACSEDKNPGPGGPHFTQDSAVQMGPPVGDSGQVGPVLGLDSGVVVPGEGGAPPVGPGGGSDGGPPVVVGNDSAVPTSDGGGGVVGGADAAPGAADAAPGGDGGGVVSSGDPEFDTCLSMVKPLCKAKEQNTAELMEQPCKALENLPVPLTNGMSYGPTTIPSGPYAGKIDWNEGADTKFIGDENGLLEQGCVDLGIDSFAQPAAVTDEIKNLRGINWRAFTIFRPACMKKGERYPVITWANGTCGETHGYSALLSTVASYGFVVIASNSTWTGVTATADGTPVQVSAIDYAEALDADQKSPLYQRLDLSKVGAMGHSQGAFATKSTAADPRVKSAIFWNTETSNDKPFLNVSGDEDIGAAGAAAFKTSTESATQPGAWIYFHKPLPTGGNNTGHLVLMMQPERVTDLAVAWWKWQLKGDQEAKKMFIGPDCGLCKNPADYEYGHNTLLQ
jgi:Chlorophyllase enzyme